MTAPFFDTSILVYAYSSDAKATIAEQLMAEPFIIGVQTLSEFAYVGRRKLKMAWPAVTKALSDIERLSLLVSATELLDLHHGMEIAERHNLATFDALMLAIALRAGCTIFYSDDMHHGLVIDNQLVITNPFV